MTPRFNVGDVINSSLTSPQRILEIRLGKPEDFKNRPHCPNWTGELCYVLQYLGGKQTILVYSVTAIDRDAHPQGSEMFEAYQKTRAETLDIH